MSDPVTYGRPRADRQRRTAITLALLLLAIFFAAWYAYSYLRNGDSDATASATSTASATASANCKPVNLGGFTTNVYNATTRNGLAAGVGTALKARGATIGKVANDPKKATISGVAQIRYGEAGKANAEALATLLTGAELVADERTDASVDVVLGAKYQALAAAQTGCANATPSATASAS